MPTLHIRHLAFMLVFAASSSLPTAQAGDMFDREGEPMAFEVVESEQRIEISESTGPGRVILGWQRAPLTDPKGGGKFAASAFLHPLATPGRAGMTTIQPADHLHHFGVWWPWKHLEVDGRKYNCWELQNGEGRQVAVAAEVARKTPDEVTLRITNRHEARINDDYVPVIREETTLTLRRRDISGYQIDLAIDQKPLREVSVAAYRYSGFSWRRPEEWTRVNSGMVTSGGHNRDNANRQPARWVCFHGPSRQGVAAFLILSGASMHGGKPELLRVWGSDRHNGAPFVSFNPVVKESLPLSDPALALRRYRLIMEDGPITDEQAEELWKAWEEEQR